MQAAAGAVEQGRGGHDLVRQAGIAGTGPAALVEEDIHQEAGADIGAGADEVGPEDGLCGIIGPDEVVGGVVVVKALLPLGADIDAQGVIGDALVAQPGLVVPEEDQDHRLLYVPEGVDHLLHPQAGIPDAPEVVVDDVIIAVTQPALGDIDLRKIGIVRRVGAVVLVGHVEGEDGALLQGCQDMLRHIRQEHRVLWDPIHKVRIVVLDEAVVRDTQVRVDIEPVVEGFVARVGALDGVALAFEVPGIAPGGPPEALQRGKARQYAPLRVDGAAGEDIGQQPTVEALGLEGVVFGVGVHAGDLIRDLGQVAEGLQLGQDDADLLLPGDIRGGVRRQDRLGGIGVVALRRRGQGVGDGVQERIDAAPGDIAVGVDPRVQLRPDGHGVVKLLAGVIAGAEPGGQGDHGGSQGDPGQGPAEPSPEEAEDAGAQHRQHTGQDDLPGDGDVLTGHLGGLGEDQKILGVDGVAAGHELPVLGPGKEQADGSIQREGQPGPVQKGQQQQTQQPEGEQIQHQHLRLGQIPPEQVQAIVASGKIQAHKAQAQAGRGKEDQSQQHPERMSGVGFQSEHGKHLEITDISSIAENPEIARKNRPVRGRGGQLWTYIDLCIGGAITYRRAPCPERGGRSRTGSSAAPRDPRCRQSRRRSCR